MLSRVRRMFRNRGLAEGLNRLKRIAVFKLYCLRNREEGGSYTTVDGRKMFLRTDDYGISLSLALDGLREKDHYQRVREFLEEGDTVLEVGANIGYFALLEAEEVGETGFVYAVEPISENIELMRKSLESNSFDNFELFEIAMSEETGEAEINLASNSNTHTMSEPYYEPEGMRTVKTMRGDDFLEDRRDPDLIRMDVEGHELEVLKGFERTFQELDDIAVFVEIHEELLGAEGVEQLFEFMDSKGFDSSQDMDKFLEENKTHVYFTKSAQ